MTLENEKRVKDYYQQALKNREKEVNLKRKSEELIKHKNELELDPKVKEYCNILAEIKNINSMIKSNVFSFDLPDDSIIEKAANEIQYEENTNNIYVYMGTYVHDNDFDIVHGRGACEVFDEYPNFDWKEYMNIELRYYDATIQVTKSDLSKFEEESIILEAPLGIDRTVFYKQVRKLFFETLIKDGQEVAVQRIKEEYANNLMKNTGYQLIKK